MPEAIFRSADMILVQFYIASEIARDCVSAFGELGNVQFCDLNRDVNEFQRSFVTETRRLDETDRKLRYLTGVIADQNVPIGTTTYDELIRQPTRDPEELGARRLPSSADMDAMTEAVDRYEVTVRQMADTYDDLLVKQTRLLEHRTVLQGTRTFFDVRLSIDNGLRLESDEESSIAVEDPVLFDIGGDEASAEEPASPQINILGSSMSFISGTIDTDKYLTLERILWRSLRGNLYLNQVPIEEPVVDPQTGEEHRKCIFVVFTHGTRLLDRCRRIVDSLGGALYDVSPDFAEYRAQLQDVNRKLQDVSAVLTHTSDRLILELKEIALEIERWKIHIVKEKAVYATMNLFDYDPTRRCLIAEGWIPRDDLHAIKAALRDVTERSNTDINTVVNVISTTRTPPTFFRTNKFTQAFQSIVDAYGIASYQEVNPGLPAIVTFPFMFAIMFGDLGHGFIVFLAALTLILKEKSIARMKNRDEIFDMAYYGRYILIMMGAFSMYTGFMYNDLFSRPLTIFKSGWKWPSGFAEGQGIVASQRGVFPAGLDSAWHGAENALLFANSYKMKLSILMGFIHMSYSLQFSLVNARFFKSRVDIIGVYIPGFLFMHSIFGYLCITIVYKWCVDWLGRGWEPPSLLNMLINMFLSPGSVDVPLYRGQAVIQVILLLVALVCVPWLLLYKPLTLRRENDKSITIGYTDLNAQDGDSLTSSRSRSSTSATLSGIDSLQSFTVEDYSEAAEEFNFADTMVNQVIYTIEFCLNCVSHTASYLRLWALSLAHNQLSSVLWNMTLKNAFIPYDKYKWGGCVIVFLLFAMWFVITVAVLVCMEGTSAMLHSLRLHWVEAMSKHFKGEGHPYTPFAFVKVFEEQDK